MVKDLKYFAPFWDFFYIQGVTQQNKPSMNVYPWTRDEFLMTKYFNKAAIASNLVLREMGSLGQGESSLELPSPLGHILNILEGSF